ncbi:MAG: ABC transporter substrate-binding protein [Pseudomonadota bacterium]|nr:ABC transporter substrate-binding protein [Pseudomonadota bacterium]
MVSTVLCLLALASPAAAGFLEPDNLKSDVEQGKLPPVAARLPTSPRLIDMKSHGRQPGVYGGTVRMLIGGPKDIRLMTIYGYARLVGYNEKFILTSDILESYTVEEGRIFTFKIRPGHKWSDGHPLTAEDFRYCFEDVLSNEDLASGGFSPYLLADGKPPRLEIIDAFTVRYTWDTANPDFLPQLAAAQPLNMAMPAHYLKQFHKKYQSEEKLAALVKEKKAKKWTTLHTRMARQYRPENPELPTLDPWRNTTEPPSEQFVFERNPYFHRVDENGRQLPYIDRFVLNASSSSIIPAKTGAGETDLQGTFIQFDDYTFLKEAEKRHPIKVNLWKRAQGSRVALLPNLNYEDPAWRKILQDARFRRALSLAIDRREINLAVFFGLGKESADTVLAASPLYRKEYAEAWIAHDPGRANLLLDELGLAERDEDGFRLLPDGRPAEVIVETAGESTLESDVLELVADHWRQVGIKLFARATQRDVFRSRVIGGQTMMGTWSGIDNGIATADMNPGELAPTTESQLQWPQWGMHYESHGERGSAPDLPEARRLIDLLKQWRSSGEASDRERIWHEMLKLYTDQVFSIGIVNATLQPVVATARLRNLPATAPYSFDPTSYFGVYMTDALWLDSGSQ